MEAWISSIGSRRGVYPLRFARAFEVDVQWSWWCRNRQKSVWFSCLTTKKALFNAIICFSLSQITSESFISEVECFHQKGIVRISQRWRLVIILGKQLDKAISMDECMLESSMMPWVLHRQPLIFIYFLCLLRSLYTWYFLSFCYFEPKQWEIWHLNSSWLVFFLFLFPPFLPLPSSSPSLPPFLASSPSPSSLPPVLPPFLSWGISKTTFLFGGLQAGLTELRKAVILRVLKGCMLKSAKDKDTEGRVQEKPDPGFHMCPPSGAAQTARILPATVTDVLSGANQGCSPRLAVQESCWGPVT